MDQITNQLATLLCCVVGVGEWGLNSTRSALIRSEGPD
jgi:hypothetical protein